MKNNKTVENELINIIFKYKTGLNSNQNFNINEREEDRSKLSHLYNNLLTTNQKILDSKCYLSLGNVQKDQTIKFLANDTTPYQRMAMISFVLRSLIKPVLFISARTAILSSKFEEHSNSKVENRVEFLHDEKAKIKEDECFPKSVKDTDIKKLKSQIKDIIAKYKKLNKWKGKLSLNQAEVLSQMSNNKEIDINIPTNNKELENSITSIVIKE